MENLTFNIKVTGESVQILFNRSSMNQYIIKTTIKELKRIYKISHYELNFNWLTKIVKENKLNIEQKLLFNSEVRILQNKDFKVQIEDSLALITNKITSEEFFLPKEHIVRFNKRFNIKDFEQLKLKRPSKIVPATTNIQTSDFDNWNLNG